MQVLYLGSCLAIVVARDCPVIAYADQEWQGLNVPLLRYLRFVGAKRAQARQSYHYQWSVNGLFLPSSSSGDHFPQAHHATDSD